MRYLVVSITIFAIVFFSSCGRDSSTTTTTHLDRASITITPSSVTVYTGGVQQFAVTVVGISNTAVTWTIREGATGGTIDASGKYTAPMAPGTYHVVAQSQANVSLSTSATIIVATATPGEAQGFYRGTFTFEDSTISVIVLPNDKFYAVYRDSNNEEWMMAGQGTSNQGNYSGRLTNYWWDSGVPVNLTATYVPGVSLAASVTVVANSYNLGLINATAPPVSTYDYNTPADLTQVVGTWSTGATITATGTFTGNQGGCTFSGSITPDPNKNFYNVTFTYGDAPCYWKNQTGSGVAVVTSVPDGTSNILVLVIGGNWHFSFEAVR